MLNRIKFYSNFLSAHTLHITCSELEGVGSADS